MSLRDDIAADLADIVGDLEDLSLTATINGSPLVVMPSSEYAGALFENFEAASFDTRFLADQPGLDSVTAIRGSTVTLDGRNYTIASLQANRDTGLTVVDCQLV